MFADLACFEMTRRFAERHGVGVAYLGAGMPAGDIELLRHVHPNLQFRQHPYPPRKIRQAAVVFVEGYHGAFSLVGPGQRLLTAPLEDLGFGLIFNRTRRVAVLLHAHIGEHNPTIGLAIEQDYQVVIRQNLHTPAPLRGLNTYTRGTLGCGANVEGVRWLVIDTLAYRRIVIPAELTPHAFGQARAEEREFVIMQNIGRALRGEQGKTAVVFLLNAEPALRDAVMHSAALIEGSERPSVFASGKDLAALIDQARRWLEAGGGAWPEADPRCANPKKKGRPRLSKEEIMRAAEEAMSAGMTWREFTRHYHPERVLNPGELEVLKAKFATASLVVTKKPFARTRRGTIS
jgi:hypothetical protein